MSSINDLKKELLKAFAPVKRTLKEYKYYIKDCEKENEKLKKMEEEKMDEGDINRQKGSVEETEGAKKATYKTLLRFINPLKEVIEKIEVETADEEFKNQQNEAKNLKEYTLAKEHVKETEEIIELEGATNA